MRATILILFFLSGVAALAYEVAWTRSLGLVFGASHLAVATVLAVYMGGQALGGALFGSRADRSDRPLRLYGYLEVGTALGALLFLGLMRAYPAVYGQLARVSDHPAYITAIRALFAVLALALPATLMGGTLPALSGFTAQRPGGLDRQLSFLYAFNTFGAVAGTLGAGFVLIPALGVTRTILAAAGLSALVGAASIMLDRHSHATRPAASAQDVGTRRDHPIGLSQRVAILGIAVSGFCALGYEVLWTRMLTLVVGTSVYSFTLMLTAFLVGIGMGSHAFGLLPLGKGQEATSRRHPLLFGAIQVAIGVSALAVTVFMRDLPLLANRLQSLFLGGGQAEFGARLAASGVIAFSFMVVPAFFMGMAFPAAAAIWSADRKDPARAVGEILVANTIGAILGPIVTGFILVYLFGIERSLQMLVVVNVTAGLAAVASTWTRRRWALAAVSMAGAAVLLLRGAYPEWGRAWNQKYFATFTNTARTLLTAEQAREWLRDVEVLFYQEGVNETVSSIRSFGRQAFIVNGRPEASSDPKDVAVQRTLGHLPMLLHPNPRRVFILGTGTGMTLGSAAAHPEVEQIVLAEIEKAMLGVARTFDQWNHGVLDDPRLEIVFNDGRNFLSTTDRKFDVISADPIHPWSGGAGYLYTVEYFQTVARRLDRGGIACQWLPIYELTARDLATVVRSWNEAFRHVLVWKTHYDTVLIGSNEPIVFDEASLARRISTTPRVRKDLEQIRMGTAKNFLEFFLMGTEGARAFGSQGVLNTDDNLWLEFSAPASQGRHELPGLNVQALSRHREDLSRYMAMNGPEAAGAEERTRWARELQTARLFDQAHAQYLLRRPPQQLEPLLRAVSERDPDFGPLQFLSDEVEFRERGAPAFVVDAVFPARDGTVPSSLRISAARQFISREWVLVSFVDNERKEIYGQRYLEGDYGQLEDLTLQYANAIFEQLRKAVADRAASGAQGGTLPREELGSLLREETRKRVGLLAPLPPG